MVLVVLPLLFKQNLKLVLQEYQVIQQFLLHKTGQTMTISIPTLKTPTLAASSTPVSQYVLAGSEATAGVFHFTADDGSVNITEVSFAVTGPVSRVIVEGKSASVVGGTATVTGLNFNIPKGFSGRTLPVIVEYNPIVVSGSTTNSNKVSTLTLTRVKYTAGNTTKTLTLNTAQQASATTREMRVVGGIPAISLNASTRSNLSTGPILLAEVTVSALQNGGPIQVKQLSISSSMAGITGEI